MSVVTAPAGTPAPSRSLHVPAAARWRRWRRTVAVVAVLLLAAVAIGIVQSGTSRGFLDPDGVDAVGARALARLLDEQGVRISPARTVAEATGLAGPDDTVLVTVPDLLTTEQVDRIVDTGARLVLVAPWTSAGDFAPGVEAVSAGIPDSVAAGCDLPVAVRAGSAQLGGTGYRGDVSRTHGARCYPVDGEPTLMVTASASGSPVVLLGSADPLTNQYLDQDGNAALALGLLGEHEHLVWYRPVPEQTEDTAVPLTDQLPRWVSAGALQLAVAAALVALWRARRLGPLVTEPLPVTVRATETTEGRARLYRRGRSREHAAGLLREASVRRLGALANLPAGGHRDPAAVADLAGTLASRTGRPASAILELLAGPPPTDDPGLVRLADELDALEKETRTS